MARAHAVRCLEHVGLGAMTDVPMSSLPAGHQRLVDVARAMALEPYAVLLDEPAAGLDHTETADLGRSSGGWRRRAWRCCSSSTTCAS